MTWDLEAPPAAEDGILALQISRDDNFHEIFENSHDFTIIRHLEPSRTISKELQSTTGERLWPRQSLYGLRTHQKRAQTQLLHLLELLNNSVTRRFGRTRCLFAGARLLKTAIFSPVTRGFQRALNVLPVRESADNASVFVQLYSSNFQITFLVKIK